MVRRQRLIRDVQQDDPLTVRSPVDVRRGDIVTVQVSQGNDDLLWKFDRNSILNPSSWPSWKQGRFNLGGDQIELETPEARARVGAPHLCPGVSRRGTLTCQYDRRFAQQIESANGHLMVTVGHADWRELWYVPQQPLRIRMRFRLLGDIEWWAMSQWLLLWQSWAPKIAGANRNEPPISLVVSRGELVLRCLNGNRFDERQPGVNEHRLPLGIQASSDWITLGIEYFKHPTDGFLRGGGQVFEGPTELQNEKCRGQMMMFGYYSYQETHPRMGVEFSDFEVRKMR